MHKPWKAFSLLKGTPAIPVLHSSLEEAASGLAKQIARFGRACKFTLARYQQGILDQQHVQARLGDTATELFTASCVFSRLSGLVSRGTDHNASYERELQSGLLYLKLARLRNAQRLAELRDNDDHAVNHTADAWLKGHDKPASGHGSGHEASGGH
jgi:hypothetical protein